MRRGVRIGIDLGQSRIGIARSDAEGMLAIPVTTVRRGEGDIAAISALVGEHGAMEVLLGLPLTMAGAEGAAAAAVREFGRSLAGAVGVPVRLVDERLSTVSAQRQMRDVGRDVKGSRAVIDQAAAVTIVQSALDREQATGQPAGQLIETGAEGSDD